MTKIILTLILIVAIFNLKTYAQQETNLPITYRTIILTATSNTGYLSVINALNLQEMTRINFDQPGKIIEITPNRKRMFIVNLSNFTTKGITVIDLENNVRTGEIFSGVTVNQIKLGPDGLLWILLGDEQKISLVNPNTLETINTITNVGQVRDIVFSPNGKLAYVSLENSNIIIYDTTTKKSIKGINNIPAGKPGLSRPMELALSPDGHILCISSKDIITILDASSLRTIDSFSFGNKSRLDLSELLFNNDGNILYISEINGFNTYTYNFTSNQLTTIFTSRRGAIQGMKLSPDGQLLYINDFIGRNIISTKDQSVILSDVDLSLFNGRASYIGIALAGDFSIGQAPSLTTTFPSSNQQVTPNQPLTIRWNTSVAAQSYSIASHKIELSTDGGTTFAPIAKAESLPADAQEFIWQVPDIEVINKAQIRVSTVDLGARRASSSSGNFSITKGGGQTGDTQAPSVIFLSPKGSEKFNSGDNLQISWMSNDNVGVTSQDLSLSTDGGNTFPITIANGLPGNSQSFSFLIPSTLQTNQARLRLIVRDAANNSSQALTQANFLIESAADTTAPIVTISQPTVNQSLIAGQPIQVNWQSSDNKAVVSQGLLLSLDGGKTFATVANFGASDNSFVIRNIEELNVTNSQGIVRITATDSSGNIGQANVQFSISPAIINATYQAKILTLMGIGFLSNSTNSTTKLFVNNKEVTLKPTNLSNNSFTIKGNKKKLGIVKGNNSVRLVVDGVESNSLMFSF